MKKILLSATHPDEKKIAVLSEGQLTDYVSFIPGMEDRRNNIYRGIVARVEQSIDACFVNIGDSKNGFLQANEIHSSYLTGNPGQPISERIKPGTPMIVQILKDSRSEKGPVLTNRVKLNGHWMLLETQPRDPSGLHVSRAATEQERTRIMAAEESLTPPNGMSVIVRTAGLEIDTKNLEWELNSYLLKLWAKITEVAGQMEGPGLIYQDMDIINRCVREHFDPFVSELVCDSEETAAKVRQILDALMPDMADRIRSIDAESALFDERVLGQIDALLAREVRLKSGAALVIDITEALVAIDVNSSRARNQSGIENTAYKTNLEAVEEIARQLRLRNLSGIIAIDFIDIDNENHRKSLVDSFVRALRDDRAQIQVGSLSEFGILEMTRQNIGRALHESHSVICEKCNGTGRMPTVRSFALNQLDKIMDLCLNRKQRGMITLVMPVEPATCLLNEHRPELRKIEEQFGIDIVVVPSRGMEMPQVRMRVDKVSTLRNARSASYEVSGDDELIPSAYHNDASDGRKTAAPAAVSSFISDKAPTPAQASKPSTNGSGFLGRLVNLFVGSESVSEASEPRDRPRRSRRGNGVRRAGPPVRNSRNAPNAASGKKPRRRSRRRSGRGPDGADAANASGSQRSEGQQPRNRPANDQQSARPAPRPQQQAAPATEKPAQQQQPAPATPKPAQPAVGSGEHPAPSAPRPALQQAEPAAEKPAPAPERSDPPKLRRSHRPATKTVDYPRTDSDS